MYLEILDPPCEPPEPEIRCFKCTQWMDWNKKLEEFICPDCEYCISYARDYSDYLD